MAIFEVGRLPQFDQSSPHTEAPRAMGHYFSTVDPPLLAHATISGAAVRARGVRAETKSGSQEKSGKKSRFSWVISRKSENRPYSAKSADLCVRR